MLNCCARILPLKTPPAPSFNSGAFSLHCQSPRAEAQGWRSRADSLIIVRMDKFRRREIVALGALAPAFVRFSDAAQEPGEEVINFLDTKPPNPERPTLPWEQTTDWMTPQPHRFRVGHYGYPDVDTAKWKLQISGLVDKPMSISLDDLKKRKAKEEIVTIECSGNGPTGGLIYNTRWKGTPLAPVQPRRPCSNGSAGLVRRRLGEVADAHRSA
jgi:DMSO/TMAO reductase YedYZ molybdopterin-dependent catalytic subunit